jgi:hypothetical protein
MLGPTPEQLFTLADQASFIRTRNTDIKHQFLKMMHECIYPDLSIADPIPQTPRINFLFEAKITRCYSDALTHIRVTTIRYLIVSKRTKARLEHHGCADKQRSCTCQNPRPLTSTQIWQIHIPPVIIRQKNDPPIPLGFSSQALHALRTSYQSDGTNPRLMSSGIGNTRSTNFFERSEPNAPATNKPPNNW